MARKSSIAEREFTRITSETEDHVHYPEDPYDLDHECTHMGGGTGDMGTFSCYRFEDGSEIEMGKTHLSYSDPGDVMGLSDDRVTGLNDVDDWTYNPYKRRC